MRLSPFSSDDGALRKSAVHASDRAKALRAAGQQARRLAQSVTSTEDRDRMLDYASTLEARADALQGRPDNDGTKE
jgi:hypothetical protein